MDLIPMTEAVRRYHIDKDRLRRLVNSGVLTSYADPKNQRVRLLDTSELDTRLAPQPLPGVDERLLDIASSPDRLTQAALIERAGAFRVDIWDYAQRRACSQPCADEAAGRAALKQIKDAACT
jgi:hypothetical protein